jgi:hypothetical protein
MWNTSALFGRDILEVTLNLAGSCPRPPIVGVGCSRGIVTLILKLKAHDQLHAPAAATPGKSHGIHYIEVWSGVGKGACVEVGE